MKVNNTKPYISLMSKWVCLFSHTLLHILTFNSQSKKCRKSVERYQNFTFFALPLYFTVFILPLARRTVNVRDAVIPGKEPVRLPIVSVRLLSFHIMGIEELAPCSQL